MCENLALELLDTFSQLDESIVLYKKIEKTYDMPMILDTNVRENINKVYALILKSIERILKQEKIPYDKYDINELLIKGKDLGALTKDNYQLLVSNFVQFNDLSMHQQHSVNYLMDWYANNRDEIEIFKSYIKEIWIKKWF